MQLTQTIINEIISPTLRKRKPPGSEHLGEKKMNEKVMAGGRNDNFVNVGKYAQARKESAINSTEGYETIVNSIMLNSTLYA